MESEANITISKARLNILLIEDDEYYRKAVESELKLYFPNARIDIAENADEVDEYINNNYDLVICDIALKKNDDDDIEKKFGITILRRLRNRDTDVTLIAWTVTVKDKIKTELKSVNARHVKKQRGTYWLFSELKNIMTK